MEKAGVAKKEAMRKFLEEILEVKVDSFIIATASNDGVGSLTFQGHIPTLGVLVSDILGRYEEIAPGLLEKILVANMVDEVCKDNVH